MIVWGLFFFREIFLKNMNNINRFLISLLLLLSIVFPVALTNFKIIILIFSFFLCFLLVIFLNFKLNAKLIVCALFYSFLGLVYSIYGEILGNPGAFRVITVMVIYPLLFSFLAVSYSRGDEVNINNIFFISAVVLIVVNLIYIFSVKYFPGGGYENLINNLWGDEAIVDSGNDDYFKFTTPNISSLCFLLSYFIVLFFEIGGGKRKLNILFLIFAMLMLMLLSGRRALFVVSILGPLFAYALVRSPSHIIKNIFKIKSFLLISLLLGGVIVFVAASGYKDYFYETLVNIFNFETNESNIERRLQFQALWDGFLHNPIFGAGAGASANYIRSESQPWAYELTYMAFLFQYGIVGLSLYLISILFLIFKMRLLAMNNIYIFSVLSGFISFMLANATNPYLAKFDYMWVIFIPVVICFSFDSVKFNRLKTN